VQTLDGEKGTKEGKRRTEGRKDSFTTSPLSLSVRTGKGKVGEEECIQKV